MSDEHSYTNWVVVEVYQARSDKWVRGQVIGSRTESDGTKRYFVQISNHAAASAADPNVWFAANQIRPAT
jgi:hypothetical protein